MLIFKENSLIKNKRSIRQKCYQRPTKQGFSALIDMFGNSLTITC